MTVIPTTSVELEEYLGDPAKVKNLMAEGQFGDFIKAYAATISTADKDMTAQIKEQVQLGISDFLKENREQGSVPKGTLDLSESDRAAVLEAQMKAPNALAVKNALFNKQAPGVPLNGMYSGGVGQMMRMLSPYANAYRDRDDLSALKAKALGLQNSFSSVVPADGGFLIPEQTRSELMMLALEDAVVRPRATTIPMESLSLTLPMVDSTSNVNSVFGGMVAYWTEESATLTESQAAFAKLRLEAKKLTALSIAPNELLADASAFGSFIDQGLPQTIAWYEDEAFLNGSGAGEPLGIFNNPATVTATISGAGPNTITWEQVVGMYARMLPRSLGSAVWVVTQEAFPQLATMALSVGTGGAPVWITDGHDAPVMTLLGRPVIVTEKAAALGTTSDISFIDFSYYVIGDRMSLTVAQSEHVRFLQDQVAYRVIERVEGRPWLQSAITPKRGTNTLSPFVQLSATRT